MPTVAGATGTPAPTKGAVPASSAAVTVNTGTLAYHTVIVLVALVALVFLLRIPRAFARFWRVSEWTRGHFLGYSSKTGPSLASRRVSVSVSYTKDMEMGGSSQDSHTTYDPKFALPVRARQSMGAALPPHMEPAPSFLRPVTSLLRSRLAPGFSAFQLVVCAGYLGILLYPSIYRSTGPFVDINRYGFISTSQIPFIFALGAKNNLLGMFFGVGYEKVRCPVVAHVTHNSFVISFSS